MPDAISSYRIYLLTVWKDPQAPAPAGPPDSGLGQELPTATGWRFFLEDHVEPLQTVGYTISTRARACPRCRVAMRENLVGDINVDRCEKCNGIWLDHGELKRIVYKYKQNRGLTGDEKVVSEIKAGLEGDRTSALGSFLGALKGLFQK
ncbi:hypothetical protein DYH09_32085 [bacterium CPR1]|nr:hypothetical protein [bacterium CPR1]